LLEVDHKFHQAIVRAAKNKHLVQIMEHFFGLSQRFWHLALPHLDILPMSVAEHSEMVASIKGQDADRARHIMYHHVKEFYNRVRIILNSNTTL
jgi:DNA-binding GntR family transcriptional regulator